MSLITIKLFTNFVIMQNTLGFQLYQQQQLTTLYLPFLITSIYITTKTA